MNLTHIDCAISPCPNDTFCFEALLSSQIDTEGLIFSGAFYDIDTLNEMALKEEVPLIKISAALYPHIQDRYTILSSGAAFSINAGPLIICRKDRKVYMEHIEEMTVAVPGLYTSAYAAFRLLFGKPKKTVVIPYHKIAQQVHQSSDIDLGLLIHEARFTFEEHFHGELIPLHDLHHEFKKQHNSSLPLGIIVAHKRLGNTIIQKIDQCIHSSILKALSREKEIVTPFIRHYAQELSDEAIKKHIELYVSDETLSMSESARQALTLFHSACRGT